MAQNWLNADGLFIQYGSDKAVVTPGGEFRSPGPNRCVELFIDLTLLTSTALILSNTLIFPISSATGESTFIEKVEVVTEVGAVGGTSFSVGFIQMDRATIPSNYSTALVNAIIPTAFTDTPGSLITLSDDSTYAGGLIGSAPVTATGPYYFTALSSGTYSAGQVRVRIYYHGVGTISQ